MALRNPTANERQARAGETLTLTPKIETGLGQMPADLRPVASPQPGVELQPEAATVSSPAAELPSPALPQPPAESDAWGRLAACEAALMAVQTEMAQINRVLVDLDRGVHRVNRRPTFPGEDMFEDRKADAPTLEEETAYCVANFALQEAGQAPFNGIADWWAKTGGLHGKPAAA
jgi:hypothetical protein